MTGKTVSTIYSRYTLTAENHAPMTILGKSNRSRRIEKQNVDGTGAPLGLSSTQCEYTDWVVFSNACDAKFSQYSTTDWFSNSCGWWTDMG